MPVVMVDDFFLRSNTALTLGNFNIRICDFTTDA
jgi:hypothetical protein